MTTTENIDRSLYLLDDMIATENDKIRAYRLRVIRGHLEQARKYLLAENTDEAGENAERARAVLMELVA
jgi:hypothetical protein